MVIKNFVYYYKNFFMWILYLGLLYPELTVHYRCGVYVVFADMHDIYV